MRSTVASHGKLTTTNWENHQSWSSYKEVAKELNVNHLMVIQHLKQTGKVKNLSKWVPHELTENQKHCHFEVTSLILCNNKEPFLNWIVMYNEKCTLYNNWGWPSQWLDWKEAPKHFPKPNLHQKNHGHCLVVCCPSDPLKLSESQWNHYIWEVCSANQWVTLKTTMPAASTGQHNGPNASAPQCSATGRTTNASKVESIGLRIFAIFTWPLANRLPLLQTSRQLFARKMLPQPAGGRKCFPKVRGILKHRFVCCRNKQTYFSLAKMCWL